MTLAAFVPARSGSKRLPGKNVKPLAGKPLVLWTLEACARAQHIDKVIFSTDSAEYWDLARATLGEENLTLDWRSPDEAGDKVKIFDYLKQAAAKIFPSDIDSFMLALPTVPLRTADHIDEAAALYRRTEKPVFSAVAYGFPISFGFYLEEGGAWEPAFADSPMRSGNTRSQDQKTAYHPNGALYLRSLADLSDPDLATLYQRAQPYIMDRHASVDIDGEADFMIAEALIEKGLVSVPPREV